MNNESFRRKMTDIPKCKNAAGKCGVFNRWDWEVCEKG